MPSLSAREQEGKQKQKLYHSTKLHNSDQSPCINENARRAACASFLVPPKRDETPAGVNATRHDKDRANETVSLVSFAHANFGRVGWEAEEVPVAW